MEIEIFKEINQYINFYQLKDMPEDWTRLRKDFKSKDYLRL